MLAITRRQIRLGRRCPDSGILQEEMFVDLQYLATTTVPGTPE